MKEVELKTEIQCTFLVQTVHYLVITAQNP